MALSLVAVGAKITAAIVNGIINAVNANGLAGVVPTSVAGTGVTLGASGKVTVAAATTISINGCFTSAYENYLFIFDLTTSAASGFAVTLRLAGTDAVTAYDSERFTAINATNAAVQSLNSASWVGSGGMGIAGASQSGELRLYSPALAVATRAKIDNNITPNPMTTSAGMYIGTLLHRTATAYDGITFTIASGNATGTIRVYGYNNN